MTIVLRPHQIAARDAIVSTLGNGSKSTLASLATGAGKTEIGLSVIEAFYNAGKIRHALWIAHRSELVTEPRDRIGHHWSDQLPTPSIVMADQNGVGQSPIMCASIQTLYSERRLNQVLQHPIDFILYDECHHITAEKNLGVIRAIQAVNPDVKLLGLTATPRRKDGDGLKKVLDSVAFKYPLTTAIKDGVLVPFTAVAVELVNTDFSGIKKTVMADSDEKEYQTKAAVEAMRATNAHELIFAGWQQVASDRPTIVFTYDVSYAHYLAQYWRDCGYRAQAVDGNTPKAERDQILKDFRSGLLQVVMNCGVWTEGLDAPNASCAVIARAVGSDSLYIQMAGRVLRTFAGKKDALIIDCLPANARDVRMAGDLLGKPKAQRKAEEVAKKKGVISQAFGINRMGEGIDGDPDEIVMRVLDYLSNGSTLAWLYAGDIATVGISDNASLAIVFPQEGRYTKARKQAEFLGREWTGDLEITYRRLNDEFNAYVVIGKDIKWLGSGATWEDVSYLAEDYAAENQVHKLAKRDEKWRKLPASDKQLDFMKRLGIEVTEDIGKGDAAQAITHKKTIDTLKEKRVIG